MSSTARELPILAAFLTPVCDKDGHVGLLCIFLDEDPPQGTFYYRAMKIL